MREKRYERKKRVIEGKKLGNVYEYVRLMLF